MSMFFALALIIGFYMAWSIGANDVANAMGTSVGSKALTLKKAVILAAILEFAGAFFLGSHVSETIQKDIVNPALFVHNPIVLACGLLSSLCAAGLWLQIASFFGWPVSTTHSIVGALLGFGIVAGGLEAIHWCCLGSIFFSWFLSPLLGGALAFLIFTVLRKKVFYSHYPIKATKKMLPWLVFVLMFTFTLLFLNNGIKNVQFHLEFWFLFFLSIFVGILFAILSYYVVRNIPEINIKNDKGLLDTQISSLLNKACKYLKRAQNVSSGEVRYYISLLAKEIQSTSTTCMRKTYQDKVSEYKTVEKIFGYLQILSACFMAFAHGTNDVANAIGPLAGIVQILNTNTVPNQFSIPTWILALGGIGIVIGLATWGWRVIETVGRKITELTPSRGFVAEFSAALTILIASKLGLPISTTHTLVGAVFGVGLARGISALNLIMIRDIVVSWIITIPAGAGIAILFFHIFKALFS